MQRHLYSDIESLSQGFAGYAATVLQHALIRNPQTTLVVPGGTTPRHYLPVLAKCPLPWERISITLSDERWVDSDDEQSNERLVKTHLMAHLTAHTRFIGLKTQHASPFDAIGDVHQRLSTLPLPLGLAVLGVGEDGHIASLFPGMEADAYSPYHCIAAAPPLAPSLRISLSLDMLAQSEHIALVVAGAAKQHLLDRLNRQADPKLPVQWLMRRSHATITVFETDNQ